MYIDKVKYTVHYDEYGQIKARWVGVDVALTDNDDPNKAFQLAQEMTEEFHKKANPHLEGTIINGSNDVRKRLMQDMRSCQKAKVLESYRLLAKSDPELQLIYDQKMNELTQKQKA